MTDLPYRPCVGVILVNQEGKVFVGWRKDLAEGEPDGHNWQMPQGGIDPGEKPKKAALRELYEETNVSSVRVIAKSGAWLKYDLPVEVRGTALKGRYRGQRQRWFLLAFDGDDNEINVTQPGGGKYKAEFSTWKWVDFADTIELIVPFKRHVYEALVKEFGHKITRDSAV